MDFFDRIDDQFRNKLPFVAYRKPKEDTIKAILQKDDHLHHLKTYAEKGFVFSPFDAQHPTILLVPNELLEISDFVPSANRSKQHMAGPTDRDNNRKEAHIQLVKKGMDEIKKGTFQKVVLSRCLENDSKALPQDLFHRLLVNYPSAFCYCWYHPKVGLWLGATPEILLMLKNRRFTTMSLAGTQKYTVNENPTWGHKELEEQQMVTDYITEALKSQVDQLKQTKTDTVRAGELLHLRTKITGLVERENLEAVVKALHPTPAVCGMPKKNARNFIRDNEHYNREFYTGFLGELNLKAGKQRNSRRSNQENQAYRSIVNTTTLYVNLRCMQLKNEKAYIYVGGGVTKDSDPEQEWEETVAKSGTMLSVLG